MKRNKLMAMICVIVLIAGVVLMGCTGETTPSEEEEPGKVYELDMAVWSREGTAMGSGLVAWVKWLDRESNGRLKVTVHWAETAAKQAEIYDAVKSGLVDMGWAGTSTSPGRFPVTEVISLPLLFQFPACLTATQTLLEVTAKYNEEIQAEWEGVRIIGYHNNGVSNIHTVNRPIHTLEDFKGLVIQGNPTILSTLGATAETLAATELYDALQKGVLDGVALEYLGYVVFHFEEVVKYTTEVGLNVGGAFVYIINNGVYNSLPSDIQELLSKEENMRQVSELVSYVVDGADANFRNVPVNAYAAAGLPGIYILPDSEREIWKEKLLPIRQDWVADLEAKGLPGEDILKDVLIWSEQYAGLPKEKMPNAISTLESWGWEGHKYLGLE